MPDSRPDESRTLELVVAASAVERLRLYQSVFGLTELRIYTSGVVIWLACVFLRLCVTTLRGRRLFAVGAVVLGFARPRRSTC